ncbi:MAG: hypothetical protein DRP57_03170 [Spirochaetes bacterium]|nr:MAG: hypothetical protein DRP57_03170 [Spirochaetota bacterium]
MHYMKRITLTSIFILIALFAAFTDNGISVSDNNGNHITSFGQLGIPSVQRPTNNTVLIKRILSNTVYKPTPGDSYQLIIKLNTVTSYILILQQNYDLDVPYLGRINAKNMTFMQLRNYIQNKIKSSIPSDYVSFVLNAPAQFDVFVYGGVKQPGMITANPLTRVWDAITAVKGLKPGASYRSVILSRKGSERTIDLSMFNLDADISQNPTLQPGDKIYIPRAKVIASINGKVNFPGYYELLPGEDLKKLIYYAGGVAEDAYPSKIEITRYINGDVSLITADLSKQENMKIKNGDRVVVQGKAEKRGMVTIEGALYGKRIDTSKPVSIPAKSIIVNVPFVQGLTLLDVLRELGGPTPFADASKSVIIKSGTGERHQIDITPLWRTKDSSKDISLGSGDYILVPIKKLQVFVSGQVFNPGAFPYVNGYKVSDYLLAAGGINPDTGDKNRMYFVDDQGNRKHVMLDTEVKPGDLIYVDKNTWTDTQKMFDNIVVVTTFTTAVITFTNLILDFIDRFK